MIDSNERDEGSVFDTELAREQTTWRVDIDEFYLEDTPRTGSTAVSDEEFETPSSHRITGTGGLASAVGTLPESVGPFRLDRILGRGGMGVVTAAVHQDNGMRAAVKLVPCDSDDSVEALLAEASGLAKLDHPNVVKILDQGEDDGFAWIATELIEGLSLAELIRGRTVTSDGRRLRFDNADGDTEEPMKSL